MSLILSVINSGLQSEVAYGKDMQDALSRLINTERTVKVEKKIENVGFYDIE